MDKIDADGIKFISRLYQDLHNSSEVEQANLGITSKDKTTRIGNYMEQLERIHDKSFLSRHMAFLIGQPHGFGKKM